MFFSSYVLAFILGGASVDSAPPLRIGLIASPGPFAVELVAGARAAVEKLNRRGGVAGHPLELIVRGAPRPWRDGASTIARIVFAEDVVALIGGSDATVSHVAAQIATRKRIPLLSLSPEQTLTEANDPWVFRGVPSDDEQAITLLRWAFGESRTKRAALAVPTEREGRGRLRSLRMACRESGVEVVQVLRVSAAAPRSPSSLDPSSDVLLLWLDPEPALALFGQMEPAPQIRILGSSRLDEAGFIRDAPGWVDGLALPMLGADEDESSGFSLGEISVRSIGQAALAGGTEPRGIRAALAEGCSSREDASTICFDESGNRRGAYSIGILRHRRIVRAPGAADTMPR